MYHKRSQNVQRFEYTLTRNDFFLDLTIHDIPISLMEDFSQHVINPVYHGEVAESIKDLMRKAILKQKLVTSK